MDLHSAQVFESGSGQIYGLVSLPDSHQVVVFYRQEEEGAWWGTCEFNTSESSAAIGIANVEVQLALDIKLDEFLERQKTPERGP